jgi:hypothetical protein
VRRIIPGILLAVALAVGMPVTNVQAGFGCGGGGTFSFSSGSGPTSMNWCVSDHGNLSSFQTPFGSEHLGSLSGIQEGYRVCANGGEQAADYGPSEHGWGAATVLAGPTASGMTISRESHALDDTPLWQLDMQFKRDSTLNTITILHTLTNLGPTANDVRVARLMNPRISGSPDNDLNIHSGRTTTAMDVVTGQALSLTNVTWAQLATALLAFPNVTCTDFEGDNPTTDDVPHIVTAKFGTMPKNKKVKTTFVYRRQ